VNKSGLLVCVSAFDRDERIAHDILLATKMVERRARPSLAVLADSSLPLKQVLKDCEAP
jgi:hypothetical protein